MSPPADWVETGIRRQLKRGGEVTRYSLGEEKGGDNVGQLPQGGTAWKRN